MRNLEYPSLPPGLLTLIYHDAKLARCRVSSVGNRFTMARMPNGAFATNAWVRAAETITPDDAAWFRTPLCR